MLFDLDEYLVSGFSTANFSVPKKSLVKLFALLGILQGDRTDFLGCAQCSHPRPHQSEATQMAVDSIPSTVVNQHAKKAKHGGNVDLIAS